MVPGIYIESPREDKKEGRKEGGSDAPMANTQTDEFIQTMTANRAQLAKADHHKEVWFYERRQREGDVETQIRKGGRRGELMDWLGGREQGVV